MATLNKKKTAEKYIINTIYRYDEEKEQSRSVFCIPEYTNKIISNKHHSPQIESGISETGDNPCEQNSD